MNDHLPAAFSFPHNGSLIITHRECETCRRLQPPVSSPICRETGGFSMFSGSEGEPDKETLLDAS